MDVSEIASEKPVPEALRWYYYIRMCGAEGEVWASEYDRANGWDVARRLDYVIKLCRRNRLDEASDLLAGCHRELQAAERDAMPAVASVMRRWYLSTKAYMLYHCRCYNAAREHLHSSAEAIAQAISEAPFLVGLATGCIEFAVHYARLARDEHKWEEMRRYFSLARAMYRNEEPLCELRDGTTIFLSSIYRLVSSLTPRDEDEQASLAFILNPQVVIRGIEVLIRRVEDFPYVVVPFE